MTETHMKLFSRQEFIKHFEQINTGLGDADSPIWIPEQSDGIESKWFVRIKHPIEVTDSEYYKWCNRTLDGVVKCYSSAETEEWWGFSNKDDIVAWSLRWC